MRTVLFIQSIPYIGWVFIAAAISWGLFGAILGVVAPTLRQDLGLTGENLGRLMAVYALGSAVGAVAGGELAKRFQSRKLLLLYIWGMLVSLILLVQARNYPLLVVCFFVIALFETAMFTVGHGLLANLSSDTEKRTRLIALIDVGWSLGSTLGPIWVGVIFVWREQWQSPYMAFSVLVVILLALFLPKKPFAQHNLHTSEETPAPATTNVSHAVIKTPVLPNNYFALLRLPVLVWTFLSGVLIGFIEWAQYFWFVSFAQNGLLVSAEVARQALTGMMFGMLLGRIWQAFVHSRWSIHRKINSLAWIGFVGLCLLNLPIAQPTVLWLFACNFLVGFGTSVAFPIMLGIALNAAPDQASRLSAMLMTSVIVGTVVAGYVVGWLSDILGFRNSYLVLIGVMAFYIFSVKQMTRIDLKNSQLALKNPASV